MKLLQSLSKALGKSANFVRVGFVAKATHHFLLKLCQFRPKASVDCLYSLAEHFACHEAFAQELRAVGGSSNSSQRLAGLADLVQLSSQARFLYAAPRNQVLQGIMDLWQRDVDLIPKLCKTCLNIFHTSF
jgi:hypothetical protein